MSTEISFYKINKQTLKDIIECCGGVGNNILGDPQDDLNFCKFGDSLEQFALCQFCGRHFIFDNLFLFNRNTDGSILIGNKQEFEKLYNNAYDIVEKYRVINDNIMQIPVSMLKDYLKRAEDNEDQIITLPLEDRSTTDYYIDDFDYYQAKTIVDLNKELQWEDNDILLLLHSY